MDFYLKNCRLYVDGSLKKVNLYIKDGVFDEVEEVPESGISVYDGVTKVLAPSFCDLHVHLREPGFSYKETIASGTRAAARGGFTTVCAMPNLDPVPDTVESISEEWTLIEQNAVIEVLPYAAITMGEKGRELADIEALREYSCGYSDDGKGVQNDGMMRKAMARIAEVDGLLAAHTEDEAELKPGGSVHDGIVAERYNLIGMPSASEYKQIARDIALVKETGCRYHICHISAKESIDLVRKAKRNGIKITCEVTPHHVALSEEDIVEDSGRFKMNPPLRSESDRMAILDGIRDGTIDIIATDHAPHSDEEKAGGLAKSAFGTVGSETAFSVCNTYLVKTGIISLERLLEMMTALPREILGQKTVHGWVLLDTETEWTVDSTQFLSRGKSTPFEGKKLFGDVVMTVMEKNAVYYNGGLLEE